MYNWYNISTAFIILKYNKNNSKEVDAMEFKLKYLSKKIEKLRKKLNRLVVSHRRLTDKPVVECSQQLDKLLTQYERCKKKSSRKAA